MKIEEMWARRYVGKIRRYAEEIKRCVDRIFSFCIFMRFSSKLIPVPPTRNARSIRFGPPPLSSSGLGRWPFTPVTRVQIPLGVQ